MRPLKRDADVGDDFVMVAAALSAGAGGAWRGRVGSGVSAIKKTQEAVGTASSASSVSRSAVRIASAAHGFAAVGRGDVDGQARLITGEHDARPLIDVGKAMQCRTRLGERRLPALG